MAACDFPECPAGQNEKVQDERHGDITKRLDGITGNQEKIILSLSTISGLLANVENLTKNFEDFRDVARKEHDEIFTRLRHLETSKADRSTVTEMQKTGLVWLWDILKIAGAAAAGALGVKLMD
jgi:hypothetical protein